MQLQGIAATNSLTVQNASLVGPVSAGGTLYVLDSSLQASVTGTSFVSLTRCNATGGLFVGSTLNAVDCTLWGLIEVAGTLATFQGCSFASTPWITFSGSTGTIIWDSVSYYNFVAAGGTISNAHQLCTDPNVPKLQRLSPEEIPAGGAGAYVTLAADGGFGMAFDTTGLTNVLIKVGVDANEFDETLGTYTELRSNTTYVMIGGVATLLESATVFNPRLIGGTHLALQLAVIGSTAISLQGYKEAAGGHRHKYSARMYVQVEQAS
jgi:hypothetical protein